jgi:amylosucrase
MSLQNTQKILNELISELQSKAKKDINFNLFYARLGLHFEDIFKKFQRLYGDNKDFHKQLKLLIEALMELYVERPEALKKLDIEREASPDWYMSQELVATMLYVDRYAGNLKGFKDRIDYLKELGVNYVHLMPLLKSPEGENDGGYAVSDYRKVDKRFGSMEDIREIATEFRNNNMLLELDLVLNHTADEHEWAQKALSGDEKYQNYYYMYDDRAIPDKFEETLPEIFPEMAPGNFTYREEINKWVFTVFNKYQWDLNYRNPEVFIEMCKILLNLANQGVDILRLDAVAFLWKRIGTDSQNEVEAHIILQLFKACGRIVAPGAVFKAEAIVQPIEIVKYLGEGEAAGKECEVAYNASFMVFLWDAIATKNTKLMVKGLENMPRLPKGTTWINYIRCHDDIGLGFSDHDACQVGYDPKIHRDFLIKYFTEGFLGSPARGEKFMYNPKTGNARITGSLAALAGLERALEWGSQEEKEKSLKKIKLLHSAIMSFGGIPLIYYGDEIAALNDYSYLEEEDKKGDNRWLNRPVMDWEKAEKRGEKGTVEHAVFNSIKRMIELRKSTPEFYNENDYEMIGVDNMHVFSFLREREENRTLIMMNFSDERQGIDCGILSRTGISGEVYDLYTGDRIGIEDGKINLEPYQFYWIKEVEERAV